MPEKIQNAIEWYLSHICNYNCSYCVSRFGRNKFVVSPPDQSKIANKLLEYLSGSWLIAFCGAGEPFLTPNFLEIVRKVVKRGHKVSVITNFSVSLEKILKFCEITRDNLLEVMVSLHLERAEPVKFLKRALIVQKNIGRKLVVSSVARKSRLRELKKIGRLFQDNGIRFMLQPERDYQRYGRKNNPFTKYSKQESDIIKTFKSADLATDKDLKFKGRLCWAGAKYFIMDYWGNAWRCAPARGNKKEYLGNLLDGTFKLRKRRFPCFYECCYCVGPISYGMVKNKR